MQHSVGDRVVAFGNAEAISGGDSMSLAPIQAQYGRTSPTSSKLVPAVVGFFLGVVVWHFVGFWGFVREVVVRGPVKEHVIVAQTGDSCTNLILDREDRSVRLVPCPVTGALLTENGIAEKGDFLITRRDEQPKRWTVTVQEEYEPVVAPADSWILHATPLAEDMITSSVR